MNGGLNLIVAIARNRAIGCGNRLLWTAPEDMARFRATTLEHTVVMGRHTWESLPEKFRPLPRRRNIVVSRQPAYAAPGAESADSLTAALALAGTAETYVIGGGELYTQALPLADRLLVTEIDIAPAADTWFPAIDPALWQESERSHHRDAQGVAFDFVTYLRRA